MKSVTTSRYLLQQVLPCVMRFERCFNVNYKARVNYKESRILHVLHTYTQYSRGLAYSFVIYKVEGDIFGARISMSKMLGKTNDTDEVIVDGTHPK